MTPGSATAGLRCSSAFPTRMRAVAVSRASPCSSASIRHSRATHSAPTDRCYDVVAEWDPIPFQRLKIDPLVRRSRLWTRGDQFWIETPLPNGQVIAWGQTADGRVWVVPPAVFSIPPRKRPVV